MMGSGKSTIGRLLAEKTGWPYYDNDVLVTMLSGETAKGLLAHEGVGEMRATEHDALLVGLRQPAPCILGAAAGTILNDEMRARLQTGAIVVWLDASPQTLTRRARGAAHRPWLEGDAEAWMTKTLAERAPLYEATADVKVGTERRTPAAVAAEIASWLSEACE
jgi:shikimate kinase